MKPRYLLYTLISILLIFQGSMITWSQEKKVSGIVTTFGKIPLANAKVFADKSGKTVYTDSTGKFSLEIPDKDILIVSAAGFNTRKVRTGKDLIYSIDLLYVDNVRNFNEAVINGHISDKVLREAMIAEEKKNEKDYSKYKSVYDLIASEIYNVRVNGNTIVNTKLRSFDRTPEVLLVVNDKIVSDISFVLPEDVKRIEFIDDVGTTLYGSMGANGVLKITLK